jgi:hypothetical protein
MRRPRIRRSPFSFAALTACTLLVGSCGGRTGDSGTGWLAGDGKPVNLALTFDPANGEAKVITPQGGSVSTSGDDGTLYQLHIPEGALFSDVRISMIPVASVKQLPLKRGSIAAVHLKPDGLRLLKPATLRIRARTEVPVAEQVAFAYFGNGKDAHLHPLNRDRSRIELPILHFSGYGFGRAAPNDPGRIALQYSADKEARLAAKLADVLSRERAKPESEHSNELAAMAAFLAQYYKEVLRPLMRIAETDERMAECALQRVLAWQRQMQVMGMVNDDDPTPGWPELEQLRKEGAASGEKIAANAREKRLERAVKRCREEHDFSAITELVAMERQAQLVGAGGAPDLARAMDAVKDCMSFEVEFHSLMEFKTPSGGSYYQLRGQASVSSETLGRGWLWATVPATAPLNYVSFSASGNPKEDLFGKGPGEKVGNALIEVFANATISGIGTRPGTLTVYRVSWGTSLQDMQQTNCEGRDETQKRQVADSFKVTLSFGTPTELVRMTPKHIGEPFTTEVNGWLGEWEMRHREQQVTNPETEGRSTDGEQPDRYQFDLKLVEPGVWRVDFKERDTPLPGFSESEASYVILRHTPK